MKRYAISEWENEDGCMEQGGLEEAGEWGDYCLYEEAHQVEVDRDIKAANLQLLVEKVLEWEVRDSSFQLSPEVEPHFEQMLDFARSLKQ